jgi:hypothetical protein
VTTFPFHFCKFPKRSQTVTASGAGLAMLLIGKLSCRLAFCAIKSQVCVKVAATELAVRS